MVFLHTSTLALSVALALSACSKKNGGSGDGGDAGGSFSGGVGGRGSLAQKPPLAASGLTISAITDTSMTLNWTDNATDEIFYEVYACAGVGCTNFTEVTGSPLRPDTTSFTLTGLTPNTSYQVQVRTANNNGASDWLTSTDTLTLVPGLTNFAVKNVSDGVTSLSWTTGSTTYKGYQIQICQGAGCTNFNDSLDSPIGAPATSHAEGGLSASTVYRFRIRGTTATNTSDWATDAGITTMSPVSAPTNFSLQSITDAAVTFSWTNNSSAPLFNEVQRCAGAGCSNFAAASGSPLAATASSYTATDLSPDTTYTYRIRAVAGSGGSDWLTSPALVSGPAAPTAMSYTTTTSSSTVVKWTDNSGTETGYQVQRCTGTSCTNFADVSGSPFAAGTAQFTSTGLSSLTNYTFRVRSVNGSATSNWLTGAQMTTKAGAASCASPTTITLDRGTKSNTATNQRGLWSDLKMIPNTGNFATAYYDGSATGGSASIRISYWNGAKYTQESVAGDRLVAAGSATWVRLVFLSDGTPLVFWTTGATQVKGAIRSAPFGTSGTWSAAVIDTVAGAANRALEVSVNPLDQVGLAYLTNTTTAGRARFIYCTSSCKNLASYVPMTAGTDTIEANNVVAATNEVGIAWCKHNSTTYYPAVVYPSTTNTRYASCQGSIATCKTSAGWGTPATIVSNSSVVAKILIDSTTTGDFPKILTRNAANTLLQVFQMDQACNAAGPYTFTAGNTFGAATSGTSWLRLLRSTSGIYHVIANLGTASVGYYNSLTNALTTSTWNTIGTLDTVTLPAAGAGAGGADINNNLGQIYTSYGANAAPFNLNVGVVQDISVTSNAANFYQSIPDVYGDIGLTTATGQTRNTSMASTSAGKPGVAYIDASVGAAAGAVLKFAFRNGVTATTPWQVWTVPNTSSPKFPSLIFDQNNMPWIAFFDASTFRYNLVTNSAADGSGDWSFYQFPINNKVAAATAPATDDVALVMSYYGGAPMPLMIVMNSTAAGGAGIRAALFDPSSQTFGSVTTLDALGGSFATRLSADYDANGNIVVAYYDLTVTKAKFNFSVDGQTWLATPLPLSATSTGREGLAIKLDPLTSQPAVSYYDRANNFVYYMRCTKSLINCGGLGNWSSSTVASSIDTTNISTNNEQILNTSLTFTADGVPFVGYMTGFNTSTPPSVPSLMVADKTSGTFVPVALATSPAAAVNNASAFNFALTGQSLASVRNSLGAWISSYTGPNNWQYVTSCGE